LNAADVPSTQSKISSHLSKVFATFCLALHYTAALTAFCPAARIGLNNPRLGPKMLQIHCTEDPRIPRHAHRYHPRSNLLMFAKKAKKAAKKGQSKSGAGGGMGFGAAKVPKASKEETELVSMGKRVKSSDSIVLAAVGWSCCKPWRICRGTDDSGSGHCQVR